MNPICKYLSRLIIIVIIMSALLSKFVPTGLQKDTRTNTLTGHFFVAK